MVGGEDLELGTGVTDLPFLPEASDADPPDNKSLFDVLGSSSCMSESDVFGDEVDDFVVFGVSSLTYK